MKRRAYRKVLPTILLVLLSFVITSTATFAWFSMNTTVKGTGISLKNTAPTNMLISVDTLVWENGVTASAFIDPTIGTISPASTVDGKNFFAIASTEGIDIDGSIVDNTNIGDVELSAVVRKMDSNVFYAMVPLYVKASEQTNLAADLQMYLEDMVVTTSSATDIADCVRISVTDAGRNHLVDHFNDNGQALDSTDTVITESSAVVYKYDTATSVLPISAVNGSGVPTLGPDTAVAPGTTTTCFTVDYTGNDYTTIIVRIWFEGQHPACLNEITGETVSLTLSWGASNYTS